MPELSAVIQCMEQRYYCYHYANPCGQVSPSRVKCEPSQGRDLAYEICGCKRRGAVGDFSRRLYYAGDAGVSAYHNHAAVFYGAKYVHYKMLVRRRGFKKPGIVGLVCKHLRAVTHQPGRFAAEKIFRAYSRSPQHRFYRENNGILRGVEIAKAVQHPEPSRQQTAKRDIFAERHKMRFPVPAQYFTVWPE